MAATTPINYQTVALTGTTTGTSNWIVVNPNVNPQSYTVAMVLTSTGTCSVQYAVDPVSNPTDSPSQIFTTSINAATATTAIAFTQPVTAFRLNASANGSGITLLVRQSGVNTAGNV